MKSLNPFTQLSISTLVSVGCLLAFSLFIISSFSYTAPALGSVAVTNEYFATSTAANGGHGATITGTQLIRTGGGALGSVIITGAAAGAINIYDATTTNILNRTGNKATSTILIASFPPSTVAGTYTFDTWFTTGLLVELYGGTMPTTTITYR